MIPCTSSRLTTARRTGASGGPSSAGSPAFRWPAGKGAALPEGAPATVFHRQEEGPGTSRGKRRQRLAGGAFVRLVVPGEKAASPVRELPAQLRRGEARVERQRHGTQAHQGAEGYHVLGAVLREQRHVAAGADAPASAATHVAPPPRAGLAGRAAPPRAVDERRLFGREVRPRLTHSGRSRRRSPRAARPPRRCLLYHTKLAAKSSPKRRWSTPVPLSAGSAIWARSGSGRCGPPQDARGRVGRGSRKGLKASPPPASRRGSGRPGRAGSVLRLRPPGARRGPPGSASRPRTSVPMSRRLLARRYAVANRPMAAAASQAAGRSRGRVCT